MQNTVGFFVSALATSIAVNLWILALYIPFALGFRVQIIAEIVFWTSFAAVGARVVWTALQKWTTNPHRLFLLAAGAVFASSLIPIYLHWGILNEFPHYLLSPLMAALVLMHIADSSIITYFNLLFSSIQAEISVTQLEKAHLRLITKEYKEAGH